MTIQQARGLNIYRDTLVLLDCLPTTFCVHKTKSGRKSACSTENITRKMDGEGSSAAVNEGGTTKSTVVDAPPAREENIAALNAEGSSNEAGATITEPSDNHKVQEEQEEEDEEVEDEEESTDKPKGKDVLEDEEVEDGNDKRGKTGGAASGKTNQVRGIPVSTKAKANKNTDTITKGTGKKKPSTVVKGTGIQPRANKINKKSKLKPLLRKAEGSRTGLRSQASSTSAIPASSKGGEGKINPRIRNPRKVRWYRELRRVR